MRINKTIFLTFTTLFFLTHAKAEDVKVSTYYPSPYGNYKELNSTSKTTLATDAADPNASVGIGTANPTLGKLQVEENRDGQLDVTVVNTSAAGANAAARVLARNSGGSVISMEKQGPGFAGAGARQAGFGALVDSGNGVNVAAAAAAGTVKFYTAGVGAANERVRINAAGNVGIGNVNPAQRLDVTGNINVSQGSAYMYNGSNVIIANPALNDYFLGGAGNLTMTGGSNTGVGLSALRTNTTGTQNTASGLQALFSNTSGGNNTATGLNSLLFNTTGSNNVVDGSHAGFRNTTGNNNTASGNSALFSNTTGSFNTAYGAQALYVLRILNGTGSNTAIGYNTGRGITTGINNTIVGANVAGLASTLSNNIIIADGAGAQRINVNNLGNVGINSGVTIPNFRLYVNGTAAKTAGGAAWTVVSDSRLKKNVAPLSGALDKMLKLRGVTFEWKEPKDHGDSTGAQMGMIAQEVEEVFPEWVGTDEAGYKNLTLSGFEALAVETIREQQEEIEALKKRVEALEKRSASSSG